MMARSALDKVFDDANMDEWIEEITSKTFSRATLNKVVMNYLVTEGFLEAAECFKQEAELKACPKERSLPERYRMRQAILEGDMEAAISMANCMHPELLDNDRRLHFHLRQQQLIELIRKNDMEAALNFAQEHLAAIGQESSENLEELERTMALLAFEDPKSSPFGDLLDVMHRQQVASELIAAILTAEHLNNSVQLSQLINFTAYCEDCLSSKKIKFPPLAEVEKCVEKQAAKAFTQRALRMGGASDTSCESLQPSVELERIPTGSGSIPQCGSTL